MSDDSASVESRTDTCSVREASGADTERERAVALIQQHYSGLVSLMHRKLRDPELASDLVNEAVAIALEHTRSGRITNIERIAGYVFQTSMNLLRNHARNMNNRPGLRADPDPLIDSSAQDGAHAVDRQRLARLVEALLASLNSDRDRDIVRRFYLNEEEKVAICTDIGISADYFDKVAFRARQRMKSLLEARGFTKGDYLGILFL